MGFHLNGDFRVHINLSNFAWNVINEDVFNFYRNSNPNISSLINDVFLNFYQEAQASIKIQCDKISNEYETMLDDDSLCTKIDPSIVYSVINIAITSHKNKIMSTINSYPKDDYKKIKLRNSVADILISSDENDSYDGNVGNYIKAIIEEYTRLPFVQREQIFCKETFNTIKRAILEKRQLKVSVRSGKKFEVIPYKIMTDKLGMFNYLVGIDTKTLQPVSYRIAKTQMTLHSKVSKITSDLEKSILKKLKLVDVSFLTKDIIDITVELDKYGVQKYNSQLHMRPNYIEIKNDNKYIFKCSEDQIKYYFLKFGSNAKILEPTSLAVEFANFYKFALSRYEK